MFCWQKSLRKTFLLASFVRYNGHRAGYNALSIGLQFRLLLVGERRVYRKGWYQMQSETISPGSPVRWGVLSVANIAVKRVIPALGASESQELVAVASRNAQRARELFAAQPGVRIYHDYQSLIDDPEIEVIYNPLPNSMHARWTIKALLAGKHVLCEKPLAVK